MNYGEGVQENGTTHSAKRNVFYKKRPCELVFTGPVTFGALFFRCWNIN